MADKHDVVWLPSRADNTQNEWCFWESGSNFGRAKCVRPVEQLISPSEVRATSRTLFLVLIFFAPVNQCVIVVVNLASQAGTQCGQLYTNVCIHSHQSGHVKGPLSEKVRMPSSQWMSGKLSTALVQLAQANGGPYCGGGKVITRLSHGL